MNIKAFCDPKHERRVTRAPFNRGEYTYATNAYIMVRVPRGDYQELKPGDIDEQEFGNLWPAVEPGYWWSDLPEVEKPTSNKTVAVLVPCGDSASVYIQAKYLNLIRRECGPARFGAIPSSRKHLTHPMPCKFVFDGGDGLVMPYWI